MPFIGLSADSGMVTILVTQQGRQNRVCITATFNESFSLNVSINSLNGRQHNTVLILSVV